MNTKQAMNTPGQHITSTTINTLVARGHEITNLWTNGKVGDQGLSIVEIDHHAAYVVDNGNADRHPVNFATAVKEANIGE